MGPVCNLESLASPGSESQVGATKNRESSGCRFRESISLDPKARRRSAVGAGKAT